MKELEDILHRIDGRGYKAYKDLQGRSFRFANFELRVEHVQGDPYAAPSRMRALVPLTVAALPESALSSAARRRATRDYIARAFRRATRGQSELGIDAGRQTVLDRTACLIDSNVLDLRLTLDLPGAGRRILGRKAAEILTGRLPKAVDHATLASHLDLDDLAEHCATVEDQVAMRNALATGGLVAFVGNGAILPRRTGIDDRPLAEGLPFLSPKSLEIELETPNSGRILGMGVPLGITLIVGGGFHGKSTLLRALETGIWDHIPGDGRERVVAEPTAVKIRSEDGRATHSVDISDFIGRLPGNRDTTCFTTDLASGSTSQAAALVEAIEAGTATVLLDEDTSATNFMIRDRRMQALVARDVEPITPFVDRVRELRDELGVSTVLVMGGSGDYFDHADHVIQLKNYVTHDVSAEAKEIAASLTTGREEEHRDRLHQPDARPFEPASIDPERRPNRWKIQARDVDTLVFGRSDVDLRAVEQIQDPSQIRAIGWILGRLSEWQEADIEPLPLIRDMIDRLDGGEWNWLTGRPDGDLACPRPHEVMATLNRLRGARFVPPVR